MRHWTIAYETAWEVRLYTADQNSAVKFFKSGFVNFLFQIFKCFSINIGLRENVINKALVPPSPPPFPFLAVPPYDLVAIYVINYAKKVWLGIERAQLYVQVYCKKILERYLTAQNLAQVSTNGVRHSPQTGLADFPSLLRPFSLYSYI